MGKQNSRESVFVFWSILVLLFSYFTLFVISYTSKSWVAGYYVLIGDAYVQNKYKEKSYFMMHSSGGCNSLLLEPLYSECLYFMIDIKAVENGYFDDLILIIKSPCKYVRYVEKERHKEINGYLRCDGLPRGRNIEIDVVTTDIVEDGASITYNTNLVFKIKGLK